MSSLDVDALRAVLVGPYTSLDVVDETGSTNADLAAAARDGAPDRTVLIADRQTEGQGRRGRSWVSPTGGLYVSVLFRPEGVPAELRGWITLLAGVAAVDTARSVGVDAVLKWPNDLLAGADRRKAAGILAEANADSVVVGMGLNVLRLPADIPPGVGGLPATSLADEGATTLDRTELAVTLLTSLADLEARWREANGDPVTSGALDLYRERCATLGSRVRVELTGSATLDVTAERIERDGTLVVRTEDGAEHPVSAGDVVHLRPAE